jgi:hypothetical protein
MMDRSGRVIVGWRVETLVRRLRCDGTPASMIIIIILELEQLRGDVVEVVEVETIEKSGKIDLLSLKLHKKLLSV